MGKTDRNYSLVRKTLIDIYDTGMIFLLVALIIEGKLEIASAIVVHNYMSRVTSVVNYVSMLLEKVKDFKTKEKSVQLT